MTITGSLSTLLADEGKLAVSTQRNLIENAYEEAERLNRLVGNLLDMTRLEAGALAIHLESCDVQDVIGAALNQMGNRLQGREVRVDVPAGLPLVPLDFVPMVQVLVNLLDNALRYSPPEHPVDVIVRPKDRQIEIEVVDRCSSISSRSSSLSYQLARPPVAGSTWTRYQRFSNVLSPTHRSGSLGMSW